MSSQAEIAEIVAQADSLITYDLCAMAAIVLYVYEYLITFPEEVAYFWRVKPTGATVLFFLTRYTTMACLLFEFVIGFISFPGTSCNFTSNLDDFIESMQYLPWAGFAALRAYALSRSRPLSSIVFVLSIVTIVVNLVDMFKFVEPAVLPFFGCTLVDTISPELAIGFAIAARASLIIADAILIVVTWVKLSRGSATSPGSLMHVVLRDGTIYFICLLILNTLHLSFTVAAIATPGVRPDSNVIAFLEPVTAILISRFMLNLQAVNRDALQLNSAGAGNKGEGPGTSSESGGGSLVFERVVGSLGSSVFDDRQEEEEETRDHSG
ncbi:hypothetical protein L227DRAFT_572699 [Lentinus tigrinus ALCF2SS1-6]|uniref:DUF6533 domain-containing protein n=1 Tax=Lentinus tigrinus ALCF2SS1-6 TaxID=1328759 RepID=A0A5C2SJT8_9APHY|nr:hypothetical protein L227DRAFT_572699 [Lentinus tigrinus ALCF2SS1-6]